MGIQEIFVKPISKYRIMMQVRFRDAELPGCHWAHSGESQTHSWPLQGLLGSLPSGLGLVLATVAHVFTCPTF